MRLKWTLVSVHLEIVLLGDEAQVVARFCLFIDRANLDSK
jgi:hypothetical protein